MLFVLAFSLSLDPNTIWSYAGTLSLLILVAKPLWIAAAKLIRRIWRDGTKAFFAIREFRRTFDLDLHLLFSQVVRLNLLWW